MTTGMVAAKAKAMGARKFMKIASSPHLRLSQLFQQQFFQRRIRTGSEEVDAAALTILAQALEKVLHGLAIRLHAVAAKGDFLHRAGLGIHQPQIAERRWGEFFRGEDLDDVHLETAS